MSTYFDGVLGGKIGGCDVLSDKILILAELESLEQGIEKLRRAPETNDAGSTAAAANAAYLQEMEVRPSRLNFGSVHVTSRGFFSTQVRSRQKFVKRFKDTSEFLHILAADGEGDGAHVVGCRHGGGQRAVRHKRLRPQGLQVPRLQARQSKQGLCSLMSMSMCVGKHESDVPFGFRCTRRFRLCTQVTLRETKAEL